jgi:Asp-tRNA(Asn)/Glu-tRNA(Gln) amidotransferase A subunit family amidase
MPARTDIGSDAAGIAGAIRAGTVSAAAVCETALSSAAAAPGIFWSLNGARARADAARVDAAVAAGTIDRLGPLAGVPVAVKDNYDVLGLPTQLGLPDAAHVAYADADAVSALRRAGAIVIGKTAMDQLAWTMAGDAPGYPPLPNPAAPGYSTGGSSGGSAAAVAAGIVPLALGTDSAGSIRVPAAWCGVIGFKPTYGRVPLGGVAPMAPSLDTTGVLARTAGDCAAALAALGLDASGAPSLAPPRCAVLTGETPTWFQNAWELLAAAGWELRSPLAQLASVRLGRILASELATCWPALTGAAAPVTSGIERGRAVDRADVDADRVQLADAELAARSIFAGDTQLLVLPSVPGPAPARDTDATVADASRYTRTLSAFGWPCASVPCGLVDGRPVGLQLAAAPGNDELLLGCVALAARVLAPSEAQHA